ncbi:hypothetical protein BJV74DRAFT_882608 [Russula compacta]|nr:hypothetical protein BJV74DRAFT_882608 [Russula compacta]
MSSNTGNTVAVRRREESVEDTQGSPFGWVTIGALPDEVLLEIFSFYMNELQRALYD